MTAWSQPARVDIHVVYDNLEVAERITQALVAHGIECASRAVALEVLPLDKDGMHVLVILAVDETPTRHTATIRQLTAEHGVRVVVCREAGSIEVRRAVRAGADGYVLVSEIETALAPAVRAVLAGQVSIPRGDRVQLGAPSLSAREKQVLGMVVMGYMNCDIAKQLFLAESTVKSHLSSAFLKLGVRSRTEAVDLILDAEQGLGHGILAITNDQAARAVLTPR